MNQSCGWARWVIYVIDRCRMKTETFYLFNQQFRDFYVAQEYILFVCKTLHIHIPYHFVSTHIILYYLDRTLYISLEFY
jgi:hypothetical protein